MWFALDSGFADGRGTGVSPVRRFHGSHGRGIKVGTGFRKGIAPHRLAGRRVEAGDFAAVAHQVNATFIRRRRGHERADIFALPDAMTRHGEVAATTEFDAVEPGLPAIG